MIDPTTKHCSMHHMYFPGENAEIVATREFFNRQSASLDGLQSFCRRCLSLYHIGSNPGSNRHNNPRNQSIFEWVDDHRGYLLPEDYPGNKMALPAATRLLDSRCLEQMLADLAKADMPIVVPTVVSFDSLFNLKEWIRGKKRPGQPKKDRKVINNVSDRMDEREAATLELINATFSPEFYGIEDRRKGIQNGADYAIVRKSDGRVTALVDSKSGNTMTSFQVKAALQCEPTGVEYWLVDPEMKRAMKITSACVFEPTAYRVYASQGVGCP